MKDVHTRHCCVLHGCKYGEEDCTVTTGLLRQEHLCEECRVDGIQTLEQMREVNSGVQPICPYCGHVIGT
jgi:hypothetical protein